jgi:hypothetical protein
MTPQNLLSPEETRLGCEDGLVPPVATCSSSKKSAIYCQAQIGGGGDSLQRSIDKH